MRTHTLSRSQNCSPQPLLYQRAASPQDTANLGCQRLLLISQPQTHSRCHVPTSLSPPPITRSLFTPLAFPPSACNHSIAASYSSNCVGNRPQELINPPRHRLARRTPLPQSPTHSQNSSTVPTVYPPPWK
jgi:hypothetical protein